MDQETTMNKRNTKVLAGIIGIGVVLGGLAGCGGKDWRVTRSDPRDVADLDYRFNANDAWMTADAMTADALSRPWLDNWMVERGGRPMIVVGNIRNNTEDYLNPEIFTRPFEEELLNSGRVRVKAQRDVREELRRERLDIDFNDPETVKAVAKEVNADLILVGVVNDTTQRTVTGRRLIKNYQIALELIDVETAEKLWINTHDIEKRARR
jgi:penicillin-binding protein activator